MAKTSQSSVFTMDDLSDFQSTNVVIEEQDAPEVKDQEIIEPQTEEEEDEDNETEDEQEEQAAESEEEQVEEEETEDQIAYKTKLHKAAAKGLAEKFGYEWNEEDENSISDIDSLAEFVDGLSNQIINDQWSTVVNSNERIAQVFSILEKEGDISGLAKLYAEEKKVIDFDITTKEGQKELLKKYYKEISGWNDERISRNLNMLEANEGLEEEALDAQKDFQAEIQKKMEKEAETQRQEAEKKLRIEAAKRKSVETYMKENNIPQKETAEYMDFLYKKNFKLKDTLYSGFEIQLLKIEQEPDKKVQLARFLKNPDAYIEAEIAKRNTKKTENVFANTLKNQINKTNGGVETKTRAKSKLTFSIDDFK